MVDDIKLLIFCGLFILSHKVLAATSCDADRPIRTPIGPLVMSHCFGEAGHPLKEVLTIGGQKILEDRSLSEQDSNKDRTQWIFSGDILHETGCPGGLYFVDIGVVPIRIIKFGVRNACNEFHWASWGQSSAVIALQKNVQFGYKDGVLTIPKTGRALFDAIEPPHAGPGLTLENAIPFAEQIPLPSSISK